MSEMMAAKKYGKVEPDRVDISEQVCSSIDMRRSTGAPTDTPDETCEVLPGVFVLSVFKPQPGKLPVGEIRIWHAGKEVRVVGKLTHRPGVIEVTPGMLEASEGDAGYGNHLRDWITNQ